jgi:hypothetical protein
MRCVRTAAAVAAGLIVVVAMVASSPVFAGGDERSTSLGATQAASGCDEAAVREAIANSQAATPDFEFQYLKCAEGFGWALIGGPNLDTATVLLRVSGTEIEVLNLGTSVCTADAGIPADVAAQIAPPGKDPAGDCPTPVPTPVLAEPDFTG